MMDQFVLDELEQALDEHAKPLLETALRIQNDASLTALDIFFILKEIQDNARNRGYLVGYDDGLQSPKDEYAGPKGL